MKNTLLLLLLFFLGSKLLAQKDSLRTASHIFWSDDYRIQMSDFQDTTRSDRHMEMCEKYKLCWGACTGLFAVMDVPRKRRDKKIKKEAIYFAPAFEVKNSYRTNSDTTEYVKQLLVFDMYEWAARRCRMELDSIYLNSPSIGIKGIFFKSVEADVQRRLGMMVRIYTQEVYIDELKGAYQKWVQIVRDLLEETKAYKTSSLDRIRFIRNEPILNGYERARNVIGNLYEE